MQFLLIIEAAILASSLSLDALTAGFAYGSNKIKIPFLSVQIINLICSGFTGLALLFGAILKDYIPHGLTIGICFTILFVLGIIKLMDGITKTIIRKYSNLKKELKFSIFNFKFILKLYADPEAADVDHSKSISPMEAASIAIALSLDGIAVGFGAALGNVNGLYVFLFSLITNAVAIIAGRRLGEKIATKIPFNLSWLSGVILIALAFSKLV